MESVKNALKRAAQGDRQARQMVRNEALAYVALLRNHILKENEILFVIGDQRMTEQDKEVLFKKFQCAEHNVLPPGTHEKYVALAKELQKLSAEC